MYISFYKISYCPSYEIIFYDPRSYSNLLFRDIKKYSLTSIS